MKQLTKVQSLNLGWTGDPFKNSMNGLWTIAETFFVSIIMML